MRIKFWGVRGSIPAPLTSAEVEDKLVTALLGAKGVDLDDKKAVQEYVAGLPPLIRGTVGGNTPCVSIEVGDEWIILDAGSGLRSLGEELMAGEFGRGRGVAHILISHTHWDHIQGFPYFRPLYISGNRITVYSAIPNLEARFRGQQEPEYFPKPIDYLRADISFVQLEEGQPAVIAGARVRSTLQAHPGRSYGYRIDAEGASVVYATDAEYKNLGEAHTQRYVEFMSGADLLIFDAQYTLSESFQRVDWGHSSSVIGVDMAVRANVKRLVLFHFEHTYTDARVQQILDSTLKYVDSDPAKPQCEVYLATEGLAFELGRAERTVLRQHNAGDTTVLTISGRFDAGAVNQVDERLTALISDGLRAGMVIDLSQVTHLSVAGLKTLLNAKQTGQGIPLVLAAAPDNVREVLAQVGFAEAFMQYETVEAAVSALEAQQYLQLQGQVLHGRYQVEKLLDMGHKAAIFKAFDTWFERPVTVKVLSKSLGEKVDQLLLHEARAVARLNHPNIASVYDCVEYQDHLYLVREFIEGVTLHQQLVQLPPGELLPSAKVIDVARDVLKGLAYAHERGVLHRHLQPKNIMVSENEVKIINFGLIGDSEESWSFNEASYASPEQLAGEEPTVRSDLYSFGATLYQLAVGQTPFTGETVEELIRKHLRSAAVPLRELNPNVPLPLERVVLNLLSKDPAHRYPSAKMVLSALEGIDVWPNSAQGDDHEALARKKRA
jgi:anti-anti-sigma factor